MQIFARACRERPDRLVAEDRLEHLLADRRGAARDHDLRAGEPAGVGKDREHHRQARPVDAERREPRGRALRGALLADEVEDDALPRTHLVRGGRLQSARRALELRCAFEQRAAGNPVAPRPGRSLGGPLGGGAHHGLDAVLDGELELGVGSRSTGDHALQPVTQQAHSCLESAHHVSRPDDLVPAGKHLAAQERPAPQRGFDLAQSLRVGRVGLGPELRGRRQLLDRRALDGRGADGKARERAPQRPTDERRPRLRVRGEAVEPGAHGRRARRPAGARPRATPRGRRAASLSPSRSSRSICRRCAGTSRSASGGTRLSTIESAVPRSRAARRNSHGTASA